VIALTILVGCASVADRDDFTAAAAKFREAWQADKLRTELFCNIGISYYKAKDLVRAHLLLGQCLEQAALDPKIVDAVRGVLVSVEGVLRAAGHTPVRVVVEPPVTSITVTELAPDVSFVGSRVVWLAFGSFHLAAHAEGYVDVIEPITTSSTEPQTVTIALHKPVDGSKRVPVPIAADHRAERPSRLPAVLVTGGTVLALGVATYAYLAGHARAELAATALDAPTFEADRTAVSRWNTTLAVAGALGLAGAAASSYLWYRALHTEAAVEVHAGPQGAGVSFGGSF